MTTEERAALVALVDTWRARADAIDRNITRTVWRRRAWLAAADELHATLAALPSGGAEAEPVCINCHLPAGDGQWALDHTGDEAVGPFCPVCWNYIVHDWPRLRADAPSPQPEPTP